MSTTPLFANFNGTAIWSADGLTPRQILEVVKHPDYPRDKIAVGIDSSMFVGYSLQFIETIQEKYGVPVFDDAKITNIPDKAAELAKLHLKHRPWMLSVMASACSSGLAQNDFLHTFSELCAETGTLSCAVTLLTSKTSVMIREEYGLSASDRTTKPIEFYADLARKCSLTDIVCSPEEINIIKRYNLSINTPGVRLNGDSLDDQARVGTPHDAISSGAKRIIVGRSIYNPANFDANTKFEIIRDAILENIQRVLDDIEKPTA